MVEDAPVTTAETTTTTAADRVEPGIDGALSELSAEQQGMLDACADALNAAASSVDAESPTYSEEVTALLMDPASDAMASCGALFDPAAGIDQGTVISFMLETLPPELLGTLSALATATGPDGTPLMGGAAADAATSDDSADASSSEAPGGDGATVEALD